MRWPPRLERPDTPPEVQPKPQNESGVAQERGQNRPAAPKALIISAGT